MATTPASSPYPLSDLFKYAGGFTNTAGQIDPETAYFIQQGYLTPQDTGSGQLTYAYNGQNIPGAQLPGGGTAAFGSFWQPQGISGTGQLINPAAVAQNTNYGTITPVQNIRHPEDTDFMSTWFPLLASAALGLGGAGAIGAVSGAGGLGGMSGSLLSKVPNFGSMIGNLFAPSTPGTAQPNASGLQALLPLLALLGLTRGG